MSTYVPGFQSFIMFLYCFCIGQIGILQRENMERLGDRDCAIFAMLSLSLGLSLQSN